MKYLYLQGKRALRHLPCVLLVIAILFGALGLVFSAVENATETDSTAKFQIGMVGTAGDSILEIGLAALQMMDSSRLSLELVAMDEDAAQAALSQGKISAYVVIPEGFMDSAFHGTYLPIRYVSTTGAGSLSTIMQDEVTTTVDALVTAAYKGVYGLNDALKGAGFGRLSGPHMTKLSAAFAKLILARGNLYRTAQAGVQDGLDLGNSLLCGLTVLLLLLSALSFAPVLIKENFALQRLLYAQGRSAFGQVLGELVPFFLCMLLCALCAMAAIGKAIAFPFVTYLPVILTVCTMSFFLYQLSRDFISGILMQFFVTLSLCFVSGCIYPVSFFPIALQKLAGYLPTGLARRQLSTAVTGANATSTVLFLLGYSALFFALSVLLRHKRIRRNCL